MPQLYDSKYHLYPVFSSDLAFEGATKRFKSFPTPEDVYRSALRGLPKFFPLTNDPITIEDAADYLEVAITEIEMSLNIDLTPVDREQSFDYIDGMFESNFTGLKLQQWPATAVTSMIMKFPHTQVVNPGVTPNPDPITGGTKAAAYQTYTIPAGWVALRRNRINVVAAFGAVSVQAGDPAITTAGGLFSYITGFGRGSYQPATIEVKYTSGFDNDKLPSSVWGLIVTLASLRFLEDIAAPLFPVAGVTVGIDGVSQSASMPGPALLVQKIESLRERYQQQVAALTKGFGRTFKMSFIGA